MEFFLGFFFFLEAANGNIYNSQGMAQRIVQNVQDSQALKLSVCAYARKQKKKKKFPFFSNYIMSSPLGMLLGLDTTIQLYQLKFALACYKGLFLRYSCQCTIYYRLDLCKMPLVCIYSTPAPVRRHNLAPPTVNPVLSYLQFPVP